MRAALATLVAAAVCACAGLQPTPREERLNPANGIDCPTGSVSVCLERRADVIHCRCERRDDLGAD